MWAWLAAQLMADLGPVSGPKNRLCLLLELMCFAALPPGIWPVNPPERGSSQWPLRSTVARISYLPGSRQDPSSTWWDTFSAIAVGLPCRNQSVSDISEINGERFVEPFPELVELLLQKQLSCTSLGRVRPQLPEHPESAWRSGQI